jgi:hypothetical protein
MFKGQQVHFTLSDFKGTGGALWSGVKHQVGDEGGRQLCSRYPPAKKEQMLLAFK